MKEDGTTGVLSSFCYFKLFFEIIRDKIILRRKFILFSLYGSVRFYHSVKTQALFQHTSFEGMLELASRQELCVFRRAAFAARFFCLLMKADIVSKRRNRR